MDGCEYCLRGGGGGVCLHLRICFACGHVGCCDSSPGRHASCHAASPEHPLVRSLEPGENWSCCVLDEITLRIPESRGTTRFPPSPVLA